VGTVTAAGTPAGTAARPHPPAGLPFFAASVNTPTGPAGSTAGPLTIAVVIGAPTGTAASANRWGFCVERISCPTSSLANGWTTHSTTAGLPSTSLVRLAGMHLLPQLRPPYQPCLPLIRPSTSWAPGLQHLGSHLLAQNTFQWVAPQL
jgi:hypothetical protein